MINYKDFINKKAFKIKDSGILVNYKDLHSNLFDFQKDIVRWSLKRGKSALFTMTGTGKTLMQCEWAKHIYNHTKENILIIAPLAVTYQTVNEAKRIDLEVNLCKEQSNVKKGINITNYERIHKFDTKDFIGIVLDESSILKSYSGAIRNQLVNSFLYTKYKLACTATPSPNDYMELGNHSEFLNVMNRKEMLAMFFIHDSGDTAKWRLKKHAQNKFWEWLANWAVVLTKPSDLEYDDGDFILPPLKLSQHITKCDKPLAGHLFALPAQTLMERRNARRHSVSDRTDLCAEIVNKSDDYFVIWCDLNIESDLLSKKINNSVEVRGSQSNDYKEKAILDFTNSKIKVLITKPSIAGFGMNWQHCHNMVFVGLSDSFEQYFQAVRRCWRFGQKKETNVYLIISELEGKVLKNIQRKEKDALKMIDEMVKFTKKTISTNIRFKNTKQNNVIANIKLNLPEWL